MKKGQDRFYIKITAFANSQTREGKRVLVCLLLDYEVLITYRGQGEQQREMRLDIAAKPESEATLIFITSLVILSRYS